MVLYMLHILIQNDDLYLNFDALALSIFMILNIQVIILLPLWSVWYQDCQQNV